MLVNSEVQKELIRKGMMDALEESFDINEILDPSDMPDGGFPLWMILIQIAELHNEGDRNVLFECRVRHGKMGKLKIKEEHIDAQYEGKSSEILKAIREVLASFLR